MKFSELVRLLEKNGFKLVKEKGSIHYEQGFQLADSYDMNPYAGQPRPT